jgi:hypothetical protein
MNTNTSGGTLSAGGGSGAAAGAAVSGGTGGASSGSGGTSATGGAAPGGSDPGGTGGTAPLLPPECVDPQLGLPDDAPDLQPGVWQKINPADVDFGSNGTFEGFIHANTLVFDPCNRGTLYAAIVYQPNDGEKAGIWRSTNAGTSWAKIYDINGVMHMAVDPADPLHLYAIAGVIGDHGFWVSTDGGFSWAYPSGWQAAWEVIGTSDMYYVATDPTDFNHALLTFHYYWNNSDAAGVVETHDGGASFTIHQPAWGGAGQWVEFLYDLDTGVGDANTWLVGAQNDGYFRTSDAGENWTRVTGSGLPVEMGSTHGGGQAHYGSDGTLYVTASNGIIKSTDNGVSWANIGPNGGHLAVTGDGTNLYACQQYSAHMQTATEANDSNWGDYPNGPELDEGVFHFSFDEQNGIVYAADMTTGFWALKTP